MDRRILKVEGDRLRRELLAECPELASALQEWGDAEHELLKSLSDHTSRGDSPLTNDCASLNRGGSPLTSSNGRIR